MFVLVTCVEVTIQYYMCDMRWLVSRSAFVDDSDRAHVVLVSGRHVFATEDFPHVSHFTSDESDECVCVDGAPAKAVETAAVDS